MESCVCVFNGILGTFFTRSEQFFEGGGHFEELVVSYTSNRSHLLVVCESRRHCLNNVKKQQHGETVVETRFSFERVNQANSWTLSKWHPPAINLVTHGLWSEKFLNWALGRVSALPFFCTYTNNTHNTHTHSHTTRQHHHTP